MIHDMPEPEKKETEKSWPDVISESMLTDESLAVLDIQPREMIIGGFCYKKDLGFIFAPRGVGKTWLNLYMSKCLALGIDCGPWEIKRAFKTLIVDGEMPLADIKSRAASLGPATNNLTYLSHERVYDMSQKEMNVSNVIYQDALFHFCIKEKFEVVLFDNLSSLSSGYDENDNAAWDQISNLMQRLRRSGITPIFIHHCGHDESRMRGGTKREDFSGWIIRMERTPDEDEQDGAIFKTTFVKWRTSPTRPKSYRWKFQTINGKLEVIWESGDEDFQELVKSGITSNKDIASILRIETVAVTRKAAKGVQEGWMKIEKRQYIYIPEHERTPRYKVVR